MNIIRIELEHIREQITHAFLLKNEEMQKMIENSLKKYCTEEWLQKTIDEHVQQILLDSTKRSACDNKLISEEIGRTIQEIILKKLKESAMCEK